MKYKDRNVKVLKELGLYDAFKIDFQCDKVWQEQDDIAHSFNDVLGYYHIPDVINSGCRWYACHTGTSWERVYDAFLMIVLENPNMNTETDAYNIVREFKIMYNRKYHREWTTESVTRRS
jgi:hypothetical protein